jgi:hypothetical protein
MQFVLIFVFRNIYKAKSVLTFMTLLFNEKPADKSTRMVWAGHVAHVGEMRSVYEILV